MKRVSSLLLSSLLLLSACGGGGGGVSRSGSSSSVKVSGQFLSSYVEGLKVCTDSGYCTYTDSNGRFQLEASGFPVHVNFFLNNLKIGNYTLKENNEIVNPFKITGSSQTGDLLARFIHGMAGDTDGSFKILNFSSIKVLDSNLPSGESVADAIGGGESVRVELQSSTGENYTVEYLPEDQTVELCKADGCREVRYRQWLVLVYMAADNNLNSYASQDLKEMASVKFNPQVKLVALTDFETGTDQVSESSDTTGDLISQPLSYEVDSGNYQTLKSFVEKYYNLYPAKNVALILWDHGDGWRGRAAAFDNTNSNFLLMFQLRRALSDLKSEGISFNLIGFDECFMGMEEVLYDIKDFAGYFLASESSEPGNGWDYRRVLSYLISNPSATPQQFGKAIVDAYREAYSSVVSDYTLTLALFSTEDIEEIARDLDRFYYDLNGNTFPDFQSARSSSEQVVCSEGDQKCSYNYVDLYTFASQLSEKYPEAQDIVSKIDSLYKTVIPGKDGKNLHGISVYFPADVNQAENSGYQCYIRETPTTCTFENRQVDDYYNPFAAGTYWDNFLTKYLSLE